MQPKERHGSLCSGLAPHPCPGVVAGLPGPLNLLPVYSSVLFKTISCEQTVKGGSVVNTLGHRTQDWACPWSVWVLLRRSWPCFSTDKLKLGAYDLEVGQDVSHLQGGEGPGSNLLRVNLS